MWPSLALGNTLVAFSTQRRYAYHALGALGAVELTAPWRAAHVAEGLKRLGVGVERKYFALHATLDIAHSEAWNEEVLRPLAAERPVIHWLSPVAVAMRPSSEVASLRVTRGRISPGRAKRASPPCWKPAAPLP